MPNSKIYLGSINIGSLFKGASDVSIYLGDEKVYPLGEPALKWLATYSDSHTESAQCGSSSEIVRNEINGTNLVSVEIGDCVTSIGDLAFDGCSSLTSITIPNSVTSIGTYAFYDCRSLTSVTVNATTPPTLGTNVFGNTNNCPIYLPSQSVVDTYKAASGWKNYKSRIQAIPNS